MAEMGDLPPYLMLIAVLAMAPVAAIPPKNGQRILLTPRATSSASGSCLVWAIPSATVADKSDSIAPSIAIAKADENNCRNVETASGSGVPFTSAKFQGKWNSGKDCGIP